MPDFTLGSAPQVYIDCDFAAQPQYTFGDLGVRAFEPNFGADARYEDAEEIVPESQLKDICMANMEQRTGNEWLVKWILNQRSEGSCVGNGWCQIVMMLFARMLGIDNVPQLSAISGYKQIGRSAGSGAMVSDALKAGEAVGLLPLDTPENRAKYGEHVMPATGFSTPWPSGDWKKTAANFRILQGERLVIRSLPELWSAALKYPVQVGRSGHSIAYSSPIWTDGGLVFPYPNSWSLNWGRAFGRTTGGWGFDSLRMAKQSASWAFAIRAVTG